ncbi:kinase [Sphingobium yanoikuyae]|jgi:D-glycerate 3-kinase|uniref:Kinase n=1 Tax=Sphingobium yanoikuyae TaxID=13690 RepID=A0A085K312_SPHYA|nr:kinase [Sphingobium yanoikuyae]AYO80422.1 kinase [Sphingobium yanoikuyae]KFD27108.1 kinase [Sphingobium yanoikuyae]KZC76299.1 kinase [Sphingobium yanoikuyae]MDV3481807.1 kinase [Sphingobium yanoikuyae]
MATSALDAVDRLALRLLEEKDGLAVLGLCGAQGSGKSTLAQGLQARMGARGVASAILSIDDLYLTKAERETLAQSVHPLLRTRGVPGTHDVALGLRVLDALAAGRAVRLPRFDKGLDDRLPEGAWPEAAAGLRLLILEGWCVGARAQEAGELDAPVNALERDEDGDGRWRRFVNAALAGHYQALFGRIDALALLAAPGFDVVQGWRTQQEAELRAAGGGSAVMNDAQVARFIQHYERLTRHILVEMPAWADLVVALDAARGVTVVRSR